jgi:antitoxin (DNA-binding transcriptional repressor) of toxin-antitoxin stability system
MLNEIGSYDAKTKLPEILRRVQSGETFTITNRGKAIAELGPSHASSRAVAKAAVENILKLKKYYVSGEQIASLKADGRK